jgi:hypothetical protein
MSFTPPEAFPSDVVTEESGSVKRSAPLCVVPVGAKPCQPVGRGACDGFRFRFRLGVDKRR